MTVQPVCYECNVEFKDEIEAKKHCDKMRHSYWT